MQVIGCLIREPMLLADPKVSINENLDFTDKLHKLVYSAIYNLFSSKVPNITTIDIDNYLSSYTVNYEYYKKKNGLQFLNDADDLAQPENFWHYYDRFKKLSALRYLKSQGYDISSIYTEKILGSKEEMEMEEKFEAMSLSDIFDKLKANLDIAEKVYKCKHTDKSTNAIDDIDRLIDGFKTNPEVGYPLYNDIVNTVVRGKRKGKLYLSSSPSGAGKSRSMVGEMCNTVFPYRYSKAVKRWVRVGNCKKALMILTEMEAEEIQTMIPAYLADVDEDKILQGTYENDEWERIECAKALMKAYPYFYIEQMPNPNVSELQSLMRYYIQMYNVEYVYYDYIFSSTGLLSEYRDLKVREDVSLLLMANGLKEIATEYNIHVRTATQLNASASETNNKKPLIRDQNMLRGSKAIADKADVGMIMMPILPEEEKKLDPVCTKLGLPMPTHVTDVYKNRRGRYTKIRIWHTFDLGTCRIADLFMTNGYYEPINIQTVKYIFDDEAGVTYDNSELIREINNDKH